MACSHHVAIGYLYVVYLSTHTVYASLNRLTYGLEDKMVSVTVAHKTWTDMIKPKLMSFESYRIFHLRSQSCHEMPQAQISSIWNIWKYTYGNGFPKHAFLWIYVKCRVIMQGLKKIDEKKTWKTKCFRFQICMLYVLWLQRTQRIVTYSSLIYKREKGTRSCPKLFLYFRTILLFFFGIFHCHVWWRFVFRWRRERKKRNFVSWIQPTYRQNEWHTRNICKSQIKCELVNFLQWHYFLMLGVESHSLAAVFNSFRWNGAHIFDIILFYFLYLLQNATVSL